MSFPPTFAPRAESPAHRAAAIARQAQLTKPAGSLGALEEIAVSLAALAPDGVPASRPAAALVFAADHPVAARGVSAYPSAVTPAMATNLLAGGAAASVLARELGVPLTVVDVGIAAPYAVPERLAARHVYAERPRRGAVGDIRETDALDRDTLLACVEAGRAAVADLSADTRLVVLGELGIGNTTVAAAVAAALLGESAEVVTGAGTGVAGAALANKREVVRAAAARVPAGADAWEVLAKVGGREIAALVGAAGEAATRGQVVLVDGFVVSVAMLVLVRACPSARARLLFAHRSEEAGHRRVLDALCASPLLDLGMRLGEASGALAALPLLDLACALHRSMATFADAGVPERAP